MRFRAWPLRLASLQPPPWLFTLLLGVFVFGVDSVHAQGESGPKTYVSIRSIEPKLEGKNWVLTVSGKNELVPSDVKVGFRILFRSATIQEFSMTAGNPGSLFEEKFTLKDMPVTTELFTLATVIELDEQRGSAKRKITSDEEKFPPGLNPWTQYHFDHRFKLVDPAQIAAEAEFVRKFYIGHLTTMARLRSEVEANAKKVAAGEEFVSKDGKFEEEKWRKWMDKDVIPELKKTQAAAFEAMGSERFIVYRRQSAWLVEISRCLNHQILGLSAKLYRDQGLEPAAMDTDKEKHELDTAGDPRRRDRFELTKDLVQQLLDSLPAAPAKPKPAEEPKKTPKPDSKGGE